MNYKDLFDRYKKGLVTDEEKALIENEIDKVEALEEYFASTFDGELNINVDEKLYEEENRKLKKSVNQKLQKAVVKWTLVIFAIYFVIFYGISGIVDMIYYDPTSTSESENTKYMESNFYYDMQAYVSLNLPGYAVRRVGNERENGFASYEVDYNLKNLFEDDEAKFKIEIERGKLENLTEDGIYDRKHWENLRRFETVSFNLFNKGNEDFEESQRFIEITNQKTIKFINDLNQLSHVSMSIVFERDINMSEFFDLEDLTERIDYKWLGIRTVKEGELWNDNVPIPLIGFNPNLDDESNSIISPNKEEYPLFYIMDFIRKLEKNVAINNYPEKMANVYETHFKSRLGYLSSRKEFLKIFDFSNEKEEFYKHSLKYVEKNGVNAYGALVYGTAEDILSVIDKIPYKSIYIENVNVVEPYMYND